jgi:RimJ/RimL family protein N-acetyltransferase
MNRRVAEEEMKLRNITTDDLSLYESLHCDSRMMAHLGGPWPKEKMTEKLRRDLGLVKAGTAWVFKVIPDEDSDRAAGSVCIWENNWRGENINEIGWMILPQFQGRGLATEAVRALLDKARSEGRWDVIHAFPSTTNLPSNAICRKTRFSLVEECELEWAGHTLLCNHWRLDVRSLQVPHDARH